MSEKRRHAILNGHREQENKTHKVKTRKQYKQEKNGPHAPDPTRYGDWERKGRCIDF
ncbi:MAG: DUF1674 domain-containing protein [Alphaproteobacteria bacterium GM7ARS4]|nr:DUF1674 domain-containing protein [Alphaproteobacteria bacterium GM7ARS4]